MTIEPITKLLVANRGEIAARIMRSARELDISTVAVHSDADSHAPFVAAADEAVHLPGNAPGDTYLRFDLIVAAARDVGADAVHPGYGFLSERAEFAAACDAVGLRFVGPSASVIESMGSKVEAKKLMAAAGVPVLASLTIDDAVFDATDLEARARSEVGFPVLVKATFGGGGRGMRIVRDPVDLRDNITAARREALAAFGDGSVFLEHYVEEPRHIEVQIFGDSHGTVVSLFERECSIQRRYQKVIEESPSPVVDDELRSRLGAAAIAAGRTIGYVGAGTVEFVLDADRNFSFLEMNTRLQVEHPVTEMVTGLDLVAVQLQVAEGRPLPPEVVDARITGHAIEARVYAEDVGAGFLPAAGAMERFQVPASPGVRIDAGIGDGSVISVHYDSMLAKVIAHGGDRDEARRRLAAALDGAQIHGVPTNRDLLVGILREPEFAAGTIDTGYLDRHDHGELCGSRFRPEALPIHALAAAIAAQVERRRATRVLPGAPTGWRNVSSGPQHARYASGLAELEVSYRFGRSGLTASVTGVVLPHLTLWSATPELVDLQVGGVRRSIRVHRVGRSVFVDSALGSTTLTELPRFPGADALSVPGSLIAPMPGTVVRIAVECGDQVVAGTALVVLEAMKMEHTVSAPVDGTVADILVTVGQAVESDAVLAVVIARPLEES